MGKLEALSSGEVLSMIKFGAAAIFRGGNREPSDAELDAIVDRARGADDGAVGALKGGQSADAASFDATAAPVDTREIFGTKFELPKRVDDIAAQWRQLQSGARERKQRIKMVASDGSGYGAKFVPVLASNDYDLEVGGGGVGARET